MLDVNILVALMDSRHVNHDPAHEWFAMQAVLNWATSPSTENGCVRVLSNPAYPTVTATPNQVIDRLGAFCAASSHHFWSEDRSLRRDLDPTTLGRMQGYQQITDFYLVLVAQRHAGALATFDAGLKHSLTGTSLADHVQLVGA